MPIIFIRLEILEGKSSAWQFHFLRTQNILSMAGHNIKGGN